MTVTLQKIEEFRNVLGDYEPSREALELLKDMPLVIFLGVTGAGRNTIINHLVDTGKYHFIVSDTTRPPKVRNERLEQHGQDYFFRPEDEVLEDLRAGKFLEAEIIHNQQVSGISIRELHRAVASGKIPINEVDIGGTKNILKAKPDTKLFFIIPPSYDVWIERLSKREVMSDQELANRLDTAVTVLTTALQDDHFRFVINDSSLESSRRIDAEIHGQSDDEHHQAARDAAQRVLDDFLKARF